MQRAGILLDRDEQRRRLSRAIQLSPWR